MNKIKSQINRLLKLTDYFPDDDSLDFNIVITKNCVTLQINTGERKNYPDELINIILKKTNEDINANINVIGSTIIIYLK